MGNDLYFASWKGVRVDPDKLAGTTSNYKTMEEIQNRVIEARNQSIPSHYTRQFDMYNEFVTNATGDAHLERVAASAIENTAQFKDSIENKLGRDVPTKRKASPLGHSYEVIDVSTATLPRNRLPLHHIVNNLHQLSFPALPMT